MSDKKKSTQCVRGSQFVYLQCLGFSLCSLGAEFSRDSLNFPIYIFLIFNVQILQKVWLTVVFFDTAGIIELPFFSVRFTFKF